MKNCDSSLIYENGNLKVYFQKSYRCFLLDWKLVEENLSHLAMRKQRSEWKVSVVVDNDNDEVKEEREGAQKWISWVKNDRRRKVFD